MIRILLMTLLALLANGKRCSVEVTKNSPFELKFSPDGLDVRHEILTGPDNSSVQAISASDDGIISGNGGSISWSCVGQNIAQIQVKSSQAFVGAKFTGHSQDRFYGVWEYPWSGSLDNSNVSFNIKGVGNGEGINWSNARAPFFITSAGYGVYIPTEQMGSFDFSQPGIAQYIFNSSTLTYYILAPESPGDFKSIIRDFTGISARPMMSPDSSYGPTFYSDNFEQDFHGYVTNAEQNYYDVVDHLYYNEIHASAMFADRPYGTGNTSWGNFDFDPKFYPDPVRLVQNLSAYGFDFQVWVANRAFLYTELYNTSVANGWLFPGINPVTYLGPALNLSIPAAYDFFKERLRYFTSIGVKGYKIDRGEEGEMPEWEQNIQDVLFRKLCYENMVEKWGVGGFHTFTRSAFDRSRAYASVWNGDAHANFSGLAYSVTSAIRAGIVGASHWTSDTGGYVRHANDPTEELWARWMQFSAFTPEYVVMVGTNHTPWYPPYSSRLVSILKDTANTHHDLIPYIRSYDYQSTQTGVPIVRALFLEYPRDDQTYDIGDEYAFGEHFLVAPIVNEGGSRKVYFPTGAKYLEYLNKTTVHEGGSTADVSLPLEEYPVYVKEGAIVPRGDIIQANNKWTKNWTPSLTIEIYPSFDVPTSSFDYYNGETKNVASITVTTNKRDSSVKVVYGDVGVSGTVAVFTKSGEKSANLIPRGGRAEFSDVQSLFE